MEDRRRWMRERELRMNGRYGWKFWLWLGVEIACAGLAMYFLFSRG